MAEDFAIKVEKVSKRFKLPHEKNSSIKSVVVNFYKRKKTYELQEALKDISFEVKKGEFLGIVGRNGSGKSTLLKILAGIYAPNSGKVLVNGKITPFIELGVGFNPELTGRENVFLNGALLGFARKEMGLMYNDIVDFAELGKFMDQKLKNYSSGMQVRLAFSIAIRVKTGILVLDEVLAVGDEAFQQKCIDIFEEYKAKKQTVVLVTHDMSVVKRFCTRALLLNEGQILAIGKPEDVAKHYSKLNNLEIDKTIDIENTKKDNNSVIKIDILNDAKKSINYRTGDSIDVKLSWPKQLQGVENAGIAIVKQSGELIFGANTFEERVLFDSNSLRCSIDLSIGPGKYFIMAGLFGKTEKKVLEFVDKGPMFVVSNRKDDHNQGLVRLKYNWWENDS